MKFKVGDVFEDASGDRFVINKEIGFASSGHFFYEVQNMITANFVNVNEATLIKCKLISGPSVPRTVSTSIGHFSSSQANPQSIPRSTYKYDIGDVFHMMQITHVGHIQKTLEILDFDKSFSAPHYTVKDHSSPGPFLTFSEEALDRDAALISTNNKSKAQSLSQSFGRLMRGPQDGALFSVDFGDMEMRVSALQDIAPTSKCSHNRKYINGAGGKAFWVCPECKADLGDA